MAEAGRKAVLAEKEAQAKALLSYWNSDEIELPEEVRLGK